MPIDRRWLTLLMNRVDPALFSAAFTGWVRETWPERPELIAIDGKTSRRSHDRAEDKAPLHLVSASPPPAASCSARRRSRARAMNYRPFPSCSIAFPKAAR
ncbi:hypothetical protein Ms3S1_p10930 (plasmid) [Methylosinus sp. 3S-1]